MSPWLENFLLTSVDHIYSLIPRKTPESERIETVKIVSHRGERDNKTVFENTIDAFTPVVEKGIWGIEFDIRWTRDLVPIVFHDADALRVFGKDFVIAENDWKTCQKVLPKVSSLEQFITRFGKQCHFMIELKTEHYPEPETQMQILKDVLQALKPVEDFHIISLDTDMFSFVPFLPPQALLPVATTNTRVMSQYALEHDLGGITGHFLFINEHIKRAHSQQSQSVGSGFANSNNVLKREINKGVDWIFTNKALRMHHFLEQMKACK